MCNGKCLSIGCWFVYGKYKRSKCKGSLDLVNEKCGSTQKKCCLATKKKTIWKHTAKIFPIIAF